MQFPLKAPPVERAASRPQKLSTKLPGKRPVLPFLCNVPLYQPSSRFLCTNTMSPSFSSISASLCGGYGTTTRYLWRQKHKDLVSQQLSLCLMGATRDHVSGRLYWARHSTGFTMAWAPTIVDGLLNVKGCVSRQNGCQEGNHPPNPMEGTLVVPQGVTCKPLLTAEVLSLLLVLTCKARQRRQRCLRASFPWSANDASVLAAAWNFALCQPAPGKKREAGFLLPSCTQCLGRFLGGGFRGSCELTACTGQTSGHGKLLFIKKMAACKVRNNHLASPSLPSCEPEILRKNTFGNISKLCYKMAVPATPTFSTKTHHDGEIFGQLDRRLDGDVLQNQTMKMGRYCQMLGLLVVVLAPICMLSRRQGLTCFLLALHLPLS